LGLTNKLVIPVIFAISLLVATLVVGLELIIFSESYFEWHYENRDVTETTEMALDDLMVVTVEMLDYLKGDRPTLDMTSTIAGQVEEVFGEREKAHMVDVRDLYLDARNLRRMALLIMAVILLVGGLKSKALLYEVLNRVRYIVPVLLVIVGVIGGLFATDFNKYFTLFHKMFFTNDLWLLNPKTDILINMVPESYFFSIVMIGLSIFALLIISAIVLSTYVAKRLRDQGI